MTEPARKSPMQAYATRATATDTAIATALLELEAPDAFGASRAAFDALTTTLAGAPAGSWTHDQLEDHLEAHGRELLRLLLQDHLDLRALRERHAVAQGQGRVAPVTDADGIAHRKLEPGHVRRLATVFGTVRVTRCAWRAADARNLYPADAVLNLPAHRHSHGLKRRAAIEAVRGSFHAAQQAIVRACGRVAGKRQVEQLTVTAAGDIDAFYAARVPMPASDDTLLCLSIDGKGVVMRPDALRETTRKAAAAKGANRYQTRLASGEKTGRKRMATVGAVYDALPAPRRPHDVAYDTALAAGWPIATGVIEGACRHLIGDRLDITGARWGLHGAEAVLKLRAVHTNGDLDAYWAFHLAQEHRRVHQARYQHPPASAA
jgi:hypothetical protein